MSRSLAPTVGARLHANVISFEPPVVTLGGKTSTIGRVVSSTPMANGFELIQDVSGTNVTAQLTFPADGVMRYEITDWNGLKPVQTSVAAASDANEHFYGFGEKFNSLDQAGNVVDILTFDNPGNKGDRSYKVAPWFISTRGYGFHFDTTAQSTFDMRVAVAGRYTITNHVGSLKFNVVYGPALTEVLSRYTGLTGRPALPPPFAFGPWISSDIWRDGGEVNYAVTKFRERGIPVSGFVFDSPWEIAYNDFKFNIPSSTFHHADPENTQFGHPGTFEGTPFPGFANLTDMMTFFRENGLKVICWMTPFVDVTSNNEGVRGQNLGEAKPDGKKDSFFVRSSKNGPPLVVPWWKGHGQPDRLHQQRSPRLALPAADGPAHGEHGGHRVGQGAGHRRFQDGRRRVRQRHQYLHPGDRRLQRREDRQGVRQRLLPGVSKTVYNVLGGKGLLFSRSGFAGTQAFPGCWAGDNQPNFGNRGRAAERDRRRPVRRHERVLDLGPRRRRLLGWALL